MIRRLSHMNVWTVFVVALMAISITPPARADVFNLNVDYCGLGCLVPGTTGGTVTLTQFANEVDIVVALSSGLVFHDQGLTSFSFNNINGGLTTANFVATFSSGSSTSTFDASPNSDGAGSFLYGFDCAAGANGCAGLPTILTIKATSAGITVASFETKGSAKVDFAANVAVSSQSGCTGVIGGGNGTAQTSPSHPGSSGTTECGSTPTPEPASIAFFGTGLLGVGLVLRRRFSPRSS